MCVYVCVLMHVRMCLCVCVLIRNYDLQITDTL